MNATRFSAALLVGLLQGVWCAWMLKGTAYLLGAGWFAPTIGQMVFLGVAWFAMMLLLFTGGGLPARDQEAMLGLVRQ